MQLNQILLIESIDKKSLVLMNFLSKITNQLGVGKHVYIVGGAVRNFVINVPIKDIDIVIDSISLKGKDSEWLAKEIAKKINTKTNISTNQYGVAILTITSDFILDGINMKSEVIEIANARAESYMGGYKPNEVKPATIEQDVKRREFTFNTLMWRLADLAKGPDKAEIIDLTGCGINDLKAGKLRCPLDPNKTFADDPTRMLRAVKFTTKYGFKITPDTEHAIKANANKLHNVPPEAIATLLLNVILKEPRTSKQALKELKLLGLIDVISDIAKSNVSFRHTLENWTTNKDVNYLIDMLDIGLPLQSKLNFLTSSQQQQLRKALLIVAKPTEFFEAVKQPGKIIDMNYIIKLSGKSKNEIGEFMKKVNQIAKQVILDNPTKSNNELTKIILDLI